MFLTLAEVLKRVPYSKATLYRKIQSGEFPQQVRLSTQKVVWRASDIETWWKAVSAGVPEYQPLEDLF